MISFYSFFWTVLISTLFIICLYFLRRNTVFLLHFGVWPLLLLFTCCIIRMLVPLEFQNHQYVIKDFHFFAKIMQPYVSAGSSIQFFYIPIFIWILVSSFLLVRFFIKSIQFTAYLKKKDFMECTSASKVLANFYQGKRLTIRKSVDISVPLLVGLVHPTIYLPAIEYNEKQLNYVILHEYTHWKNKDLLVKLFTNIFCILFWWNPFVYLLKKDLSDILELKCDRTLAKKFSEQEKVEYMETLLYSLKNSHPYPDHMQNIGSYSVNLIHVLEPSVTRQRFQYMLKQKTSFFAEIFCTLCVLILLCGLMILSYCIILQPAYDPPIEDCWEEGVDFFADSTNTYLVTKDEDTYLLYGDGEFICEVPKEEVEAGLYSYVPIIDEGKSK